MNVEMKRRKIKSQRGRERDSGRNMIQNTHTEMEAKGRQGENRKGKKGNEGRDTILIYHSSSSSSSSSRQTRSNGA